jgi:hypothetical protein
MVSDAANNNTNISVLATFSCGNLVVATSLNINVLDTFSCGNFHHIAMCWHYLLPKPPRTISNFTKICVIKLYTAGLVIANIVSHTIQNCYCPQTTIWMWSSLPPGRPAPAPAPCVVLLGIITLHKVSILWGDKDTLNSMHDTLR